MTINSDNAKVVYLTGPTAAGKTGFLIRKVSEWIDKRESCLIVTSSSDQRIRFRNNLLLSVPYFDKTKVLFATFHSLIRELVENDLDFPFSIASPLQEFLVVREILRKNSKAIKEQMLSAETEISPGIIKSFKKLFSEFNSALAFTLAPESDEKDSAFTLLASLYKKYTEALHERGFCSIQEAEFLCAQRLAEYRDFPYHHIVIDGFYEFIPIQEYLLKKLTQFSEEAYVSLTYSPDIPGYEYTRRKLPSFFQENRKKDFPRCRSPFKYIHDNIFFMGRKDSEDSEVHDEQNGKIVIHALPTDTDELYFIRAKILDWLQEGVPVDEIAVLYYNTDFYINCLPMILGKDGIPCNFRHTRAISEKSAAQFLLKCIYLSVNLFEREALLSFLALKHFQKGNGFYLKLQRFASLCGIRQGLDDWEEKPEKTIRFYTQMVEEGDNSKNEISNFLTGFKDSALEFINNLTFPESGSPEEYFRKIRDVLLFLTEKGYCRFSDSFRGEIKRIIFLLRSNFRDEKSLSLQEFYSEINLILNMERENINGEEKGIFLRDIMESRGISWRKVLFAGLNEGVIPGRLSDNPLLSNQKRALLKAKNVITLEDHAWFEQEQKLLFLLGLTRATEETHLTYSLKDDSGKEQIPSPFISDLEVLLAGKEAENCQQPAKTPEQMEYLLYTPFDALLFFRNEKIDDYIARRFKDTSHLTSRRSRFRKLNNTKGQEHIRFPGEFAPSYFTASRLEAYTFCPFLYFSRYILYLEKMEEPVSALLPRIEGEIAHLILAEMVNVFIREKGKYGNWISWLNERGEETLDIQIRRISQIYYNRNLFIHPFFWEYQMNTIRKMLERFISVEIEKAEKDFYGFYPFKTEFAFGKDEDTMVQIQSPEGEAVRLIGIIDRLDISRDGRALRVIDYKRSSAPSISGIRQGVSFQFPIYIYAANKIFTEKEVHTGFCYNLREARRQGFINLTKAAPKSPKSYFSVEEIEDILRENIFTIREKIESGEIAVLPRKNNYCKPDGCEYYGICRYEKGIFVKPE